MRNGLIGAIGLSALFWATAPLAETAADQAPTVVWADAETLDAALAWGQARADLIVTGTDRLARRVVGLMPVRPTTEPLPLAAASAPMEAVTPAYVVEQTEYWTPIADGAAESWRLTTRSPLRRADGAPVPPTPRDALALEPDAYDLRYDYHWPAARTTTATGWQVDLRPHAGVGYGERGGTAQAGATVRVGRDLDRMVPEGRDAFGDRGRWYLFAAGEGRAVGYNFARNRDGGFDRSGMSHDAGTFFGDATVGVAWRRGDIQTSLGLTYREVEAEGLRLGREDPDEVEEGLIAFQMSIKPDW